VSAEVERLRTQHADAVREKSTADSKCRKLADKVAALEGEKTDLRRQLAEERKEANEALAKAQAAQAEANLARVEGGLARERAEQLEERLRALQSRVERAEAATSTEAERTRKQLMDSYMSWARGPLSSKCRTESPDFAAWSGYRRSCRRSPLSWRGLCLMLPWSPARGR
jgi:chromosome segregation ATPase